MKSHKLVVNRGTFNVRDRGNHDGTPLVMIHGWPESSRCWEPVTAFLRPDLRVVAPDLRGLGDSERSPDLTLYRKSELAKDMAEVVDALGIDTFFLAGHDWGGAVAQELALLVPQRVKKLVIMNIPVINNLEGNMEATKVHFGRGSTALWYQHFQRQPRLPEAMIKGNEELWIRHFLGSAWVAGDFAGAEETIAEYARCYAIPGTPGTAANYYRSMRQDIEHWATLAGTRFHMPALYIHGKNDPVIIPEYLRHIGACFDQVRVEVIESNHFVQEEKPEAVAKLLNDFLV